MRISASGPNTPLRGAFRSDEHSTASFVFFLKCCNCNINSSAAGSFERKMCFFIFGLFVCYLFVVSSNCHDFLLKSVHVEGFYFTSLSVSLFNILSSDPLRAPGRVGLMKTTTLMMKCKTLRTSLRGQKVMKLREHKHINH